MDSIDLDACKARQTHVLPALGANNTAVAEYVISSILILLRKAYQSAQEMGQKFSGLSNLILTSHIAGVTVESNIRVSALTAENVRKALAG